MEIRVYFRALRFQTINPDGTLGFGNHGATSPIAWMEPMEQSSARKEFATQPEQVTIMEELFLAT